MESNKIPKLKEIYVHGYLTKRYYYDKYGNLSTIELYTGGYIRDDEVFPLIKETTIKILNHGKVFFITRQNFDSVMLIYNKKSSIEGDLRGYINRKHYLTFEPMESITELLGSYALMISLMAPIESSEFKNTDVLLYYRE